MQFYHVTANLLNASDVVINNFNVNNYYKANLSNGLGWIEDELEKYRPADVISRKNAIYCWGCKYCAIRFMNRLQFKNKSDNYKVYEVKIINPTGAPMEILDYLSKKDINFNNLKDAIAEYWNPNSDNEWHKIEFLVNSFTVINELKIESNDITNSLLEEDSDGNKCIQMWG